MNVNIFNFNKITAANVYEIHKIEHGGSYLPRCEPP